MWLKEVDGVLDERRAIGVRHLPIFPAAEGRGNAVVKSQFIELGDDGRKGTVVADPVVPLAEVGSRRQGDVENHWLVGRVLFLPELNVRAKGAVEGGRHDGSHDGGVAEALAPP